MKFLIFSVIPSTTAVKSLTNTRYRCFAPMPYGGEGESFYGNLPCFRRPRRAVKRGNFVVSRLISF
uniref:Uncharacterized protein n=1 Tax=Manihot esculenta TaxID=3983 RepID=A0A2C9U3J1_MANES